MREKSFSPTVIFSRINNYNKAFRVLFLRQSIFKTLKLAKRERKKKKCAYHLLSDKIILNRSIFSFASIWKE